MNHHIHQSSRGPLCDRYRFTSMVPLEDAMPTFSISENHCGTHAPIWLVAATLGPMKASSPCPSAPGINDNCCQWTVSMDTRDCSGGHFVHCLLRPPVCFHAHWGPEGEILLSAKCACFFNCCVRILTSAMRRTAQVSRAPSLIVTVDLELSWDQIDKHAWVSQRLVVALHDMGDGRSKAKTIGEIRL